MLPMELKVERALEGQSTVVTKGCRCLHPGGSSQQPDHEVIVNDLLWKTSEPTLGLSERVNRHLEGDSF